MQAITSYAILAAIAGGVLGSFLNVVIYRLPRGESLMTPRSHCTSCGTAVKPYDNVPVLAWLWLRGHCRSCRVPISGRYPVVEGATAALWAAVVATRSSAAAVALGLLLVVTVVPLALIDLDHHIIPNRITAPAAIAAIVFGSALDLHGEPARLIAGAAAGGFFLLVHLINPRGMGMGDVKLAAVLGLILGREVAPAIFVALLAGVIVGAVVLARAQPGDRRARGVPFGPFLAFGALVALFAGHALLNLYLNHLA
ncbi:MAG: prepilin peptidase [Solirubrobacteraceae bacterium]|jgi:leader peptidase (prepilin peptidase)/N-methyltransferase